MGICTTYPVIDMRKTGENIKRIREKYNISVRELQRYLGLESPQAIYQWQRGISLPTVDHLCALSHLFGITMNEILVLKGPSEGNHSDVVHVVKNLPMAKKLILLAAA